MRFWVFRHKISPSLNRVKTNTLEGKDRRNKLSLQGTKSSGYAHFWNTHLHRREVVMDIFSLVWMRLNTQQYWFKCFLFFFFQYILFLHTPLPGSGHSLFLVAKTIIPVTHQIISPVFTLNFMYMCWLLLYVYCNFLKRVLHYHELFFCSITE